MEISSRKVMFYTKKGSLNNKAESALGHQAKGGERTGVNIIYITSQNSSRAANRAKNFVRWHFLVRSWQPR